MAEMIEEVDELWAKAAPNVNIAASLLHRPKCWRFHLWS
jgi:hypothetical protein